MRRGGGRAARRAGVRGAGAGRARAAADRARLRGVCRRPQLDERLLRRGGSHACSASAAATRLPAAAAARLRVRRDVPGTTARDALAISGSGMLEIRFATPQANVSLWASAQSEFTVGGNVVVEALAGRAGPGRSRRRVPSVPSSSPFGGAAVLRSTLGHAGHRLRSRSPAPAAGRSSSTTSRSARWRSRTPRSSPLPRRSRDPATRASCSSATSRTRASTARSTARRSCRAGRRSRYSGLAAGRAHLHGRDARPLRHARRDAGGVLVDRRSEPGLGSGTGRGAAPRTRTATASRTRSDNCPPRRERRPRPTADADGVGDACETAPSGATPPVTGETVVVEVLSGEVFVKLPASSRRARRRRCPASCR